MVQFKYIFLTEFLKPTLRLTLNMQQLKSDNFEFTFAFKSANRPNPTTK